jgi:hypothetical protein
MMIPQGGTKTYETSHKNALYRFQRTRGGGTNLKTNTKYSKLWALVKIHKKTEFDFTHYKFANIYRISICAKIKSKIGAQW